MYGQKETLYNVLDLPRNAKAGDIDRAYRRVRVEMDKPSSPADPRRMALVHEAHEVLSDPERRAAYDASLKAPKFLGLDKRAAPRTTWVAIGAGLVVLAAALYFVLRPPSKPPAKDPRDILIAASATVGRLQSLDLSGQASTVGHVFAIREGTLVTTCHGLRAGAQLVAKIEPRSIGARVSMADEVLDLCKLSAEDVGSQPLRIGDDPKKGDKVYAVRADAQGKLQLVDGTVKEFVATPEGKIIEVTMPISPEMSGGPLLDTYGTIVGIATAPHPYGEGRNIALPVAWINAARSRTVAPQTQSRPRK
jgi:S1-C subfamily serine protease